LGGGGGGGLPRVVGLSRAFILKIGKNK